MKNNNKIKLIVDSACDVSKEFAKKHDIAIVPLSVIFCEQVYKDGVTITNGEFFDMLENSGMHPTSSMVNQHDFEEVFAKYVGRYQDVVVITLSSFLSGTYQSAVNAVAALGAANIHVFDSLSVSIGSGAIAGEVAKAISAGAEIEEVKKRAEYCIEHMEVLATFESLKYLKAGGRMNSLQALIGTMLKVKILLSTREGSVVGLEKIMTTKKIMRRIKDLTKEQRALGSCTYFGEACMHGEALEIIKKYQEEGIVEDWELFEVGPTVGVHTGPNCFGVAFFKK